jgi:hypothetical protein
MGESIREMLAPDGVFFFEVQYLLDIIDRMLIGTIFHEHMCHHSVKPMMRFLNRHGMELIDLERVMIQKGSLIGTVQRVGGPRAVAPIVREMVELEDARRLETPETIRTFSTRLKGLHSQMQALLAEWKQQGKTVAAFGAARSGPTLIAQLGLEKAIQFVVDDHPQKVGKYTPGHHFPVLPTAELVRRKPDYTILLAFLHADKIIASNREYLEQGGHFVVCCPEVQIVSANSKQTLSAAA